MHDPYANRIRFPEFDQEVVEVRPPRAGSRFDLLYREGTAEEGMDVD